MSRLTGVYEKKCGCRVYDWDTGPIVAHCSDHFTLIELLEHIDFTELWRATALAVVELNWGCSRGEGDTDYLHGMRNGLCLAWYSTWQDGCTPWWLK